ncbi:hypothetical protein JYU34_016645 [Plutella xylostella]|uniref:Uncharacterized protein n=1 Tax=Plutella xylostella TaxID=51655 RepID=A0ABQ7Q4I6_PLUXY|nr:hypothetical protein JYU34_016645 [Plutella xylostella]
MFYYNANLHFIRMMNIDKFGHHVHKRMRVLDPLECISFNKALFQNESGDYDLKQRRLKGLKLAVDADEAVNKAYVDQNNNIYCKREDFLAELKSIKTQISLMQQQLSQKCSKVDASNIIKDQIVTLRDLMTKPI